MVNIRFHLPKPHWTLYDVYTKYFFIILNLFGIECCYSTYMLWAPIFHQQEDQDNGFTFFNAGGLCFVNRHGRTLRRAGWVAFTKVTDIAFTSDFCNNYSHSASLYLTSPRPRPTRPRVPYLMSSSPSSRDPKSQVPTHASRCSRPLVPVPLLYTAHFYSLFS